MTPAVEAARSAGIAFKTLEYEHDPAHRSFGLEAVEALDLDPEAVFKTLVASVGDGGLVVGVVPVMQRLDLRTVLLWSVLKFVLEPARTHGDTRVVMTVRRCRRSRKN